MEDKGRPRERDRIRDRRDRDYDGDKDRDRHDRYENRGMDRKKSKGSPSLYVSKSRTEVKDTSPDRPKKKDRDHDDKPEEKKKEKKIKDKKKKKDSEEKEKKKKKKKEKKLIQKEALKEENAKTTETEAKPIEEKPEETVALLNVENIKVEESKDSPPSVETSTAPTKEFEEKSLAINPEPPDIQELNSPKIEETEVGINPSNPNFKPIPELKTDIKTEMKTEVKAMDSLYSGLDDTEINTVITEKYAILPEVETADKESPAEVKSPKKDEFLAPVPELSKWERDETAERPEGALESEDKEDGSEEATANKIVTSEVLKRAENAIFQKAINAIRPIEIKKISESRKILYQNPEPKVEVELPREQGQQRKSVNVTINVGRNERNVEISEPAKKAKLDRSKFKSVPDSHSPTRLSAKERLGEKVEDDKERKLSPKSLLERREIKTEPRPRSRSPRNTRERRISPMVEKRLETIPVNTERKVFLEERRRERDRVERPKERNDSRSRQEPRMERESRIDPRPDLRADLRAAKIERERERERDRTPPITFKKVDFPKTSRKDEEDEKDEKEKEKEKRKEKKREEKRRKKEHRSRSKSKERKKKKEKKHKREKEKHHLEKKQKHKEKISSVGKAEGNEEKAEMESSETPGASEVAKKQRKNPRLISDRKRSMLDEASFEPDYSASDSESDGEEKIIPVKKAKMEDIQVEKEVIETKFKKRQKSPSSDDESSSTETTSSDSESSDESHKKRKKKHKKHKKRKSTRKETSSDTDSYSDSSDSSSEEERHRKKSKKSKKSKQKKKKKSKHK